MVISSPTLPRLHPSPRGCPLLPHLGCLAPLLLLVLLASPYLPPSLAQSHSPLSGQGLAPHPMLLPPPERHAQGDRRARQMGGRGTCASAEGGEELARVAYTPVFVSVVLNKLLAVDDERYQFEVIVQLRMSWHDPRAPLAIRRRTEETFLAGQPGACARVCAKGRSLCCDAVWLPGVMGGNLLSLEDERTEWEAIALLPGNHSNVRWGRRLRATFHAALRFHRYPFDTQQLVMELWAESCCYSFVPSAAAIRLPRTALTAALQPPHPGGNPPPPTSSSSSSSRTRDSKKLWREQSGEYGRGKTHGRRGRVRREEGSGADDLSGWQVESVFVAARAMQPGRMVQWVEEPHADEVFSVLVEEFSGATAGGAGTAAMPCGGKGEEDGRDGLGSGMEQEEGGECGSGRVESSEWMAWQKQQQRHAAASVNATLLIVVRVQRIWHYYLFLFLLPTFLAVALSWTSFCVSPEHLELRVGTGITLFLALTSHQFIIFDNLPHSSYVTIMGWFVIWSYALIVAAVLQSLLVNYVYSIGETAARERNESAAARATRRLLMGSAGVAGKGGAAGSGGAGAGGSHSIACLSSGSRWQSLSPQALSLLWRPSASVVAAAAEPLLAEEVRSREGGGRQGEGAAVKRKKGSDEGGEGGREGVNEGREGSGCVVAAEGSVASGAGGSASKPARYPASGKGRAGEGVRDKPSAPVMRQCTRQSEQDSEGKSLSRQPIEQEGEAETGAEKRNGGSGSFPESESFVGLSHLSKRIQRTVAQASQLKGMVEQDPHRAKTFITRLDGLCLVLMPLLYVGGLLWIYMVVE
ncbi:hypothetical protein CLOM_g7448 [Closterium sp. NIES-68]|nr:hypothetical protein CLOM_g7448 [Closterium sp. NIES-68]GJP81022.1 hypothetical protein CLOP_g11205 [Closterium sp. NIES-67]